jgi:pSer/pThr/pTyr-binding forkhead associated (FHA) protein
MAKPDSHQELTSTLHLGLRSIVGNSPADHLSDFLANASEEEREIVEKTLNGDGSSAMIFIHRGAQKGARFSMAEKNTTVGRSSESIIFLDDVTVSRKHAVFTKSDSGFIFSDSGSLNGSYVNNELVSEKVLVSGDEIQIGKFHLLFICAHSSK